MGPELVTARRSRAACGAAVAAALACGASSAPAQEPAAGVRHEVTVALSRDPAVAAAEATAAEDVTVVVSIVDHALQSHFSAGVVARFPSFDPKIPAPAQKVWEDRLCHQNRGVPKLAVVSVLARIPRGDSEPSVAAVPRHIGLRLPADEIIERGATVAGSDATGSYRRVQAQTTRSGYNIDAKLYAFPCRIGSRGAHEQVSQ